MDNQQRKMFEEFIESHRRMIKHHRRQILELTRLLNQTEHKMDSLGLNIKK